MNFKLDNLHGVIPQRILDRLPGIIQKYSITNIFRLSHFLGQADEETGNFTRETENLNYSAQGLLKTFPKHFSGPADAASYEHQPEKIANRIYADRMGNGNEASGDGWKYRGRGDIQLTGKDAYLQLSKFVGTDLVANPDLVATTYELDSAAYFFMKNGIWQICDKGVDQKTISLVTYHVNGGYLNLDVRVKYTMQIYNALNK